MKKLTIAIAIITLALLMWPPVKAIFRRPESAFSDVRSAVRIENGAITVYGPGNTLAAVAKRLGDPEIFSYSPAEKKAVCRGNLAIVGELILGDKSASGLAETLEFETHVCGDCMVFVRPQGSLKAYNAEISTVDRSLSEGLCPRGYGIVGEGEIIMNNVHLAYMSGSSSTIYSGSSARGNLNGVVVHGGESFAFTAGGVDGEKVSIRNCNFLARGTWGAWVRDTSSPLLFDNTTLIGNRGDILIEGADVILLDCRFRPGRVAFAGLSGSVTVQWRQGFQVLDSDGNPVQGALIRAESSLDAGISHSCKGTTDQNGMTTLILTEYKATASCPELRPGINDASPYQVTVTAGDRQRNIVVEARYAQGVVTVHLPAE